jgi:hypothetical protein
LPSKDRAAEAARVGALERWHPHDTARLAEARRDLRAAQLTDHVLQALQADPPLTMAQRAGLAAALLEGGDAA